MIRFALDNWLVHVVRLGLGAVFVWAGIAKLIDVPSFIQTVTRFAIIPEAWAAPFALSVIWIELLAGALLLADLWPRSSALALLALLATFVVALGVNIYRGNDFDCGCFGAGGSSPVWALTLDLLLAAAALLVVNRGGPGHAPRIQPADPAVTG